MTTHALIAIRRGEANAVVGVENDEVLREIVTEWALDPEVSEIIRVPVDIARSHLFQSVDDLRAAVLSANGGRIGKE